MPNTPNDAKRVPQFPLLSWRRIAEHVIPAITHTENEYETARKKCPKGSAFITGLFLQFAYMFVERISPVLSQL
jgi:hypothetical protein